MYIINDYELIETDLELYLSNYGKGIKIPSQTLKALLYALKNQPRLEISQDHLIALALNHGVEVDTLKKVLISQLNVLKPMQARKFPAIYINSDDTLVAELLQDTLKKEYDCHLVTASHPHLYSPSSLVIFYRKNYSHADFKTLYREMPSQVYFITAGVLHKLLIIDNLYFKDSGLPSHFSNLHQLIGYLKSDIPATRNNWLLFYRELLKQGADQFPDSPVNACQQGYIAYCLHQFAAQFTQLWGPPTPLDKINWFWHVDLSSFTVHQEIAVHSPFAEEDRRLDLSNRQEERVE
ncbi:hypothetical protein GH742_09295 [Legionella sp. MW5194]|uniref:hypothetical protein n=1 Tax=Legionella sp. MW5194 TaxID=2662448 RepID=UPI00193DA6E9|nr:hypothetical protein [Legionella sp. MW5194]QRN04052.1 hypothetical protein GH742_09295 [Legionella sp. MW5194]